jgi:hypothetical protein
MRLHVEEIGPVHLVIEDLAFAVEFLDEACDNVVSLGFATEDEARSAASELAALIGRATYVEVR